MTSNQEQPEILWKPANDGRDSRVEHFRRFINRKHGLALSMFQVFITKTSESSLTFLWKEDYYDLHKYSVEDWEFWRDAWEFLGITSSAPPQQVRNYFHHAIHNNETYVC